MSTSRTRSDSMETLQELLDRYIKGLIQLKRGEIGEIVVLDTRERNIERRERIWLMRPEFATWTEDNGQRLVIRNTQPPTTRIQDAAIAGVLHDAAETVAPDKAC